MLSALLDRHFAHGRTPFSEERNALAEDERLQTEIIAFVEPVLSHFCGGRCEAGNCNPRLSCLRSVTSVVELLRIDWLRRGLMKRAWESPHLMQLLSSTVDYSLGLSHESVEESGRTQRALLLCSATAVMHFVLGVKGGQRLPQAD